MEVDLKVLGKYKEEGWLKTQTHPTLPLTIWNYTQNVQFESHWDEVTLMCRGLVTDDLGNIIARPFKKFFNYSELVPKNKVPKGNFTVWEKLDGSYIQVFNYMGEWVISSRGSFTSDQAIMAREIWDECHKEVENQLYSEANHIFELIHPQNRIVLDYGENRDLILLGIVYRDGVERPLNNTSDTYNLFSIPKVHHSLNIESLEYLKSYISDDKEGYAVVFDSGERMKIKGDEYMRLHRIVTHTSSKDIWKTLKEDGDLQELIERTPDEWTDWVYKTIGKMYAKREVIRKQVNRDFQHGVGVHYFDSQGSWVNMCSRRDTAEYVNTCQYPHLLFNILDGKSNYKTYWEIVRPDHEVGFSI